MSCIMLSNESLAILANSCAKISIHPDYYQISAPSSLCNALHALPSFEVNRRAQKIFERLYLLNANAYDERYKKMVVNLAPSIDLNMYDSIQPVEYDPKNRICIVKPFHYRLYKIIQCYLYQVDDNKTTRTDPLVLALYDLKESIGLYIIENTVEYHAACWG